MKKTVAYLFFLIPFLLMAQKKQEYVRSSLHLHLIDDFTFQNGDKVKNSYNKFEFPENYNNHTINLRSLKLSDYELSPEEIAQAGVIDLNALSNGETKIQNNKLVKYQLDKYIDANNIAHKLVEKWFNIDENGNFNNLLIDERLAQNQSVAQAAIADASDVATDQSIKLINNTFVVFTRLFYVSNEIAAEVIRQVAYEFARDLPEPALSMAKATADKIYEKTKEGYSVWTTAWLYQLVWSQSTINDFASSIDLETKRVNLEKFNKLDFELEFLSQERATSLVTFSLKKEDKDRTEQDVFDLSTIRNMNKVLTKLQKKNTVFKPIFPLRDDFSVACGTKEGISGGETFEVLEYRDNDYHKIGSMKVDKKRVWDNSYTGMDVSPGLTYFKKGNKKYIPGIHYVRFVK
jgi:hypothetical protein